MLQRQKATKQPPSGGVLSPSDSLPIFPSSSRRSNSKVSLKVILQRGIHVAGTKVQGCLEIGVKEHGVGLGEIGIELQGSEELRNRDHTSTRRLLYRRLLFQGQGLPPSNAVVPDSTPISGGYYTALRGRTQFAFSFDLPKDLPSSCAFGANGVVRYELRAFASSLHEGDVDIKSEKKDVLVVERWDDWRKGNWTTGVERDAEQEVKGREGGSVSIKASVGLDKESGSLPRLFWWRDIEEGVEGKGEIEVRIRLKNATKRHIAGLNMTLVRRLRLHRAEGQHGPPPPQISTSVTSIDYLGTDHDVRAGSEREVLVTLQLPKQECWNVRKGSMFDLDCFVRVQVEGGFLEQKLFVELPVYIAHPFSVSTTAQRLIDGERRERAAKLDPPAQAVPFLRSPKSSLDFSERSTSPSHGYHQSPVPPTPSSNGHYYPQSTVSHAPSTNYNGTQQYSSPPPQPPSSAPPLHYGGQPYSLPTPHNGYVAFDPNVPDLTASRFLGSLQDQQPNQVFVRPDSAMNVPVGPIHPPSSHSHQSQAYHFAPPPPPPSLVQPPHASFDTYTNPVSPHRPRTSMSYHSVAPPDLRHLEHFSPAEQRRVAANIGPIEPYSAMIRATSPQPPQPHRTASAPAAYVQEAPFGSSPPPSCPSPAPPLVHHAHSLPNATSTSNRTPHRTPPPPSPSSQFRQRSVSPSFTTHLSIGPEPIDERALDTIGEDGESQAGTSKSTALTASALAALRDDDSSSVQSVRVGNSPGRTSVQDLEELVAEEERKYDDEKRKGMKEKTLPQIPNSGQRDEASKPMRAQDIFSLPDPPKSPSPPSRASPATSPKPSESSESGLAALRARLARSTTPLQRSSPSFPDSVSRSPSPTKPSTNPDLRSLSPSLKLELPGSGTSALRARSISRASRQRDKDLEKALKDAEEDPSEAVRKALSKKTNGGEKPESIPPPNVSSAVFKAVSAMKSFETMRDRPQEADQVDQSLKSPVASQVKVTSRREETISPPARYEPLPAVPSPSSSQSNELEQSASPPPRPQSRPIFPSTASKRHALPALPVPSASHSFTLASPTESAPIPLPEETKTLPSLPPISTVPIPETSFTPISPVAKVNAEGRKIVDAVEQKDLKKDAVARISNWLADDMPSTQPVRSSSGSPWSMLNKSTSNNDIARKRRTIEFGRTAPPPPTTIVSTLPTSNSSTSRTPSPSKPASSEPTVAQLLAAETRAALRLAESTSASNDKPSPVMRGLDGFLAAAKKDEEFEPKYHHSSARGGKGGKVSSVASIWASREEMEGSKSPPLPPSLGHKSTKSLSTIPAKQPDQPLSPLGNSTGRLNRRSLQTSPTQQLSPSGPVKPFLNTTIGRASSSTSPAAVDRSENVRRPLSQSTTASKPPTPSKVKDLLARYQQQIA